MVNIVEASDVHNAHCWSSSRKQFTVLLSIFFGVLASLFLVATIVLGVLYGIERNKTIEINPTTTQSTPDTATIVKINEYVSVQMEKQKIAGISLAIIQGGQIIHGRGYGYSNIEHQVPVKLETIFQSGSVGKQFTSMAVMMLVERGKIELDATIDRYFVDVPNEWKNITVRHLLTHTSGMNDYPKDFNFRKDYTEDDMYKLIKTIPLTFQPGEQWTYSNLGYVMLGILIRRVTNQFYGDFLKQYIFNPLDMTTARVIGEADIILNRAAGYVLDNNELKNQYWVAPSLNTFADGALYFNIYDMTKWDAALYGDKLLKHQASFDEMWNPVKLNNDKTYPYGFGWRLSETINGMRTVYHGGAWQGFRTMIIRILDAQLTVIAFYQFRSGKCSGTCIKRPTNLRSRTDCHTEGTLHLIKENKV